MLRVLFVTAALVTLAVSAARPKWHQLDRYTFDNFVADFGRRYQPGSDEYKYREKLFNDRLASVKKHNADSTMMWKRGVNMFSDMSAKEWKNYNKHRISPLREEPIRHVSAPENGTPTPLPREVDYRTWNSPRVLTAIKHQGSCGNCWAQSGIESMEAYYALLTGMLPVLSTQQMTSCTPLMNGCDGGDYAVGWMTIKNGTTIAGDGLTEEWAYPFVDFFFGNKEGHEHTAPCRNISKDYPAKPYSWFAELNEVGIEGYGSVKPNDATSAMFSLATIGPQSISVASGNWQDYETGILHNVGNGTADEWQIDHAVQMVGYGHDKDLGQDYWLVRNSWSTLWGEDGFIRLLRPKVEPCSPSGHHFGHVCGTSGCLCDLQYPIVKKNTPRKY